ncbi:hypothetical protein QQG55_24245 [Brugia pahangi]
MFLNPLSGSSSLYSEANTLVYDEINDAAFVRQESFLGKRTAGNLTIVSGRNTVNGRYRTKKGIISTSNTVDGESAESTVLATKNLSNWLIYPLRKIGSMNQLKLQKVIHDAIHEKQMELLEDESTRQ